MKKAMLLGSILLALSLSVPTDLSFAGMQTKKQTVQGKAKQVKKPHAKKGGNAGPYQKAMKKKSLKKAVYKKPRYARNINQPHEGELLKLEGMVKDLNEQ